MPGFETPKTYSPSAHDVELLRGADISLEELLSYHQPSKKELEKLQRLSSGSLVEIMLSNTLRGNTVDALNQIEPLTFSFFPQDGIEKKIDEAHDHFIEITELRLSQNIYPGKGFSKDACEKILTRAKEQRWDKGNVQKSFDELRVMLNESSSSR